MLVKPREKKDSRQRATEEEPKAKPKRTRTRAHTCVCNKCHKEQPYVEQTVTIQYSINGKKTVQIEGIERVCAVCGWHVDDIEVSRLNKEIADRELLNS